MGKILETNLQNVEKINTDSSNMRKNTQLYIYIYSISLENVLRTKKDCQSDTVTHVSRRYKIHVIQGELQWIKP